MQRKLVFMRWIALWSPISSRVTRRNCCQTHVRTRQDSVPWSPFKGLLSAGILGGDPVGGGVSCGDGLWRFKYPCPSQLTLALPCSHGSSSTFHSESQLPLQSTSACLPACRHVPTVIGWAQPLKLSASNKPFLVWVALVLVSPDSSGKITKTTCQSNWKGIKS